MCRNSIQSGNKTNSLERENISDVLDMTVDTAADFFLSVKITNILNMLKSVGLGYIKLGQSSLTFSGRSPTH